MSGAAVIAVRVTPRSNRDAVEGADQAGELRVRVTAPPTDGAANRALIKLLAASLAVPKGAITVVSGGGSRHKRLRVDGIDRAAVQARWPGVSVTAA